MIDVTRLSSHYKVRLLTADDENRILDLCRRNPLFYEFTEARPTREEIQNDMTLTPPGIDRSAKYYIGFFENRDLVAVMDIVDGYPNPETAYIGFFMMNPDHQGKHIGTEIISETAAYLKVIGKTAIRLAIDKGNPQSSHFWKKNGFITVAEADVNGWTKLVSERSLQERMIAACGNDCSACPRYAMPPFEKTEEELHHTAVLWMKIGYRDHVLMNEEISCTGCRPENWCRYHVVTCCKDRDIKTCAECTDFPCDNMKECFKATRSFEPVCREICTDAEFEQLEKAFFVMEKNLLKGGYSR